MNHPTSADLDRLLAGRLTGKRRTRVVAHLLNRCPACNEQIAAAIVRPRTGDEPAGDQYEQALDNVFARFERQFQRQQSRADDEALLRRLRLGEPLTAEEATRLHGPPVVEYLLAESRALRHRDPERMLELAELARLVVDQVEGENIYQTADLKARTWAELANAYRVGDDLHAAADALQTAVAWAKRGSDDALLRARLGDLAASLYSDQGRFGEAERVLVEIHGLYMDRGETHLAGRALIKRGLFVGYDNRPIEAIALLTEGAALVDFAREPVLQVLVVHNVAWFLVDAGQYRKARIVLWRGHSLYHAAGDRLNLLRLQWLQGRIAAGLKRWDEAERVYQVVRRGLKRAGQNCAAALVALELMDLWVRQGRRSDVAELAGELLAVFRSLGIAREAIAVLILVQEWVQLAWVPAEILRDQIAIVARLVREVERNPRKRASA